ncbi:MAG TPA: HEAT repeat domain-containing protein [Nitrospira sp.]
MSDLKSAQDMIAAAMAAKQNADPEVTSVSQLLKSLDRASKNVRTFGHQNPVAKKFFEQFYSELTAHLTQFNLLTFVVQREGLFFKEELVYGSHTGDASENFAFKFYSDGIREITFRQDILEEDVLFFFDALWDTVGAAGSEDDDIVTRMWARNLPTLTIVTADEVMKISELDDILTPQGNAPLDSSLREILAEARAKATKETDETKKPKPRIAANVTGYEVSQEELAALAKDIAAESSRNSILYLLDVMTAIFSSERTPALLLKLLELYGSILSSLVQGGHWSSAMHVLELLSEAETIRPDLTDAHKLKIQQLFEQVGSPDVIDLIESYLNKTEMPRTDGLPALFLMMKPRATPALCTLLGNLEQPAHQMLVVTALLELAKDCPEHVARHLTDHRPTFVRHLLGIITRWNNPQLTEQVEATLRYPDPLIRREAIRTLAVLKPNGSAAKLIPMMSDNDEGVRLATLKSLLTGSYNAPFSIWDPIVTAATFGDRDPAERRNIFHAMRLTSGDEAVPFWTTLLTEWGWTNRKKREDLAMMAIDALGKLGTAAAQEALTLGTQKGTSPVKQACIQAIAGVNKHPRSA